MTLDRATGKILGIGQGKREGTWEGESMDLKGKLVLPVCVVGEGGGRREEGGRGGRRRRRGRRGRRGRREEERGGERRERAKRRRNLCNK